jgi:hypothetical protein
VKYHGVLPPAISADKIQQKLISGLNEEEVNVADPHWYQCGFGSGILGNADPDTVPDPGFDDRKLEKIYRKKNFLIENCNFLIPRPL